MWEWSIPDQFMDVIQENALLGDASLIRMLREIAADPDAMPAAGAHQLFEDVYLIQVNRWVILYERLTEVRLLVLSDLSELDQLIDSVLG